MQVRVDRSSVAMGDDVVSHAMTIDVPAETSLADVVASIRGQRYLAQIAGGLATWVLTAGGRPVAVVAQQWDAPRFLVDAGAAIGSFGTEPDGVTLLFRYWVQRDPDAVFDDLAAGREPPRG